MQKTIHSPALREVKVETIARIAAILFFSSDTVNLLLSRLLSIVSLSAYSGWVTIGLIYCLLMISCVKCPSRYIKVDFCLLLAFLILFFYVSEAIHPEYEVWYKREDYGVWPYVMSPLNGLYGYLFVRLYDEPEIFKKDFKIAGWLMLPYFVYQIFVARNRGFWYGVAGQEGLAQLSYSVSFGYRVILYMFPFLYDAFTDKKPLDISYAAFCGVIVLLYGSRGGIFMIALFVSLYIFMDYRQTEHVAGRHKKLLLICIGTIILYMLYDRLFNLIGNLSEIVFKSRFLSKLSAGEILSDSGRNEIWAEARLMIQEKPWGYGAMGSQHRISSIIIAGYPHSIIYEMLIDYGVFVGSGILMFLFVHALKIIIRKQKTPWADLFLCFFCASCCLFISLCYWSNRSFWPCIAIGVNYYVKRRKERVK